mgnify:CR=1 FL=1
MKTGNEVNVSVAEIMHKRVVKVESTSTAQYCAKRITQERVGCIIVTTDKKPVGIITERGFADLVKKGNFDCKKVTAQNFMTKPIISIDIDATYEKALRLFEKEDIKRMPVVEDGDVVGLLTLRNLITHTKKSMRALKRENNLLSSMAKQRGMTRE